MSGKQHEQIIAIFESLSPADQAAVVSFAEFLRSRAATAGEVPASAGALAMEIPEPELGSRPQDEKVVAAIKRLSKAYYMLDKSKMLGVTSDLVTQHILQGREAAEVIDELEQIFADHYRRLKQGDGG
jgi:hypothetical protein